MKYYSHLLKKLLLVIYIMQRWWEENKIKLQIISTVGKIHYEVDGVDYFSLFGSANIVTIEYQLTCLEALLLIICPALVLCTNIKTTERVHVLHSCGSEKENWL